jgi:hypothetical protein
VADANDWWLNKETDPEPFIIDSDEALQNVFDYCFEAGFEQCPIWQKRGPSAIFDYYVQAEEKLKQKPIRLPTLDLDLDYGFWRQVLFSALYQEIKFPVIAYAIREISRGSAGKFLPVLVRLAQMEQSDDYLIDPKTGYSNGDGRFLISCTDKGARNGPKLTDGQLEDLSASWQQIGRLASSSLLVLELLCQRKFPFFVILARDLNGKGTD